MGKVNKEVAALFEKNDEARKVVLLHVLCPLLSRTQCMFYALYGEVYRETKITDKYNQTSCHTHAGKDDPCAIAGIDCKAYRIALQRFKENQK